MTLQQVLDWLPDHTNCNVYFDKDKLVCYYWVNGKVFEFKYVKGQTVDYNDFAVKLKEKVLKTIQEEAAKQKKK